MNEEKFEGSKRTKGEEGESWRKREKKELRSPGRHWARGGGPRAFMK